MQLKSALAFALLALLVGGAGALAWMAQPTATTTTGATGAHHVRVEGSAGRVFDGDVFVQNATALSALQAAAQKGGFRVEVVEYPGMGAYVRAIGQDTAQGGAGWIFEVDGRVATAGADASPLAAGQAVTWRWSAHP